MAHSDALEWSKGEKPFLPLGMFAQEVSSISVTVSLLAHHNVHIHALALAKTSHLLFSSV